MAEFDLDGAVRQARTGAVPRDWALYPLRAVSAWVALALTIILTAFGVGGGIYTLTTGLMTGEVWAPAILFAIVPDSGTIFILLGEVIIFAAFAVFGMIAAVNALRTMRDLSQHFLLFTPQYFALVNGKKARGAAYADVLSTVRSNGGSLEVKLRSGKTITLRLAAYGKPDELHALLVSHRRAALQQSAEGR